MLVVDGMVGGLEGGDGQGEGVGWLRRRGGERWLVTYVRHRPNRRPRQHSTNTTKQQQQQPTAGPNRRLLKQGAKQTATQHGPGGRWP